MRLQGIIASLSEAKAWRTRGRRAPYVLLHHKALSAEDKVGVMLPCNVIVQEAGAGKIEVAAIDPRAAMERVGNPALADLAREVAEKLTRDVSTI